MTFSQIVRTLELAGVEDASFEAAVIAERYCGVASSHIPFLGERELSSDALCGALSRRSAGEPLQYIVGEWDFMSETYEVTPSVLIPRQDTETLVEWAIKSIPPGGRFADLCTGSGCIAISTLAAREDLTCVASDKYRDALDVAERNAKRNGVSDRVRFVLSDVLAENAEEGPFDAILSNPPYVTAEEYGKLGRELYFEPRYALTDGADGLTFYRRILDVYPERLKDGGAIAFEIGSSQAGAVTLAANAAGMTCEVLKDLSGHDRAVICKKK